jgi:hypothetical protein
VGPSASAGGVAVDVLGRSGDAARLRVLVANGSGVSDAALVRFARQHAATLRRLHLTHCAAGGDTMAVVRALCARAVVSTPE